tara:strand:- start:719 stop:1492 length:774 start_codon:yes stop_codon:yes gene_type:complete
MAEWKFTEEITLLIADKSERVRTQALIALSGCAAFIPREEAVGLAKQLQSSIDTPKKGVSVEEVSATCLALEALYTDNVVIPPWSADLFEDEEFADALNRLSEENLESNQRLRWIFFMMFGELRDTNNALRFVRRIRRLALSGDPALFSYAYEIMQRQEVRDPIVWRCWIRQLDSHQDKLDELQRIAQSRAKDLELSGTPDTNDKAIEINNCMHFLESARDAIKHAEQGSAGQPATRSESDSEGGDKPQPESEGRSR